MDKRERLTRIQKLQAEIRRIEGRAGHHIFTFPSLRDKGDSLLNFYEEKIKELRVELEEHKREHRSTLVPRVYLGRPRKVKGG